MTSYRDLPLGVQKLIEIDYERHLRENFKEVEGEVMLAFFQQDDIQQKWLAYREDTYRQQEYEAERDGAWIDYLSDQLGLEV